MSQTAQRAATIIDDVRAGRISRSRAAVTASVAEIYPSLSDVQRNRIIYAVLEEIAEDAAEPKRRPKEPANVLAGDALVEVAAGFFEENPRGTARTIYRMIVSAGHKVGISESSFVNGGHAKRARDRAGVVGVTGRLSEQKPEGGKRKTATKAPATRSDRPAPRKEDIEPIPQTAVAPATLEPARPCGCAGSACVCEPTTVDAAAEPTHDVVFLRVGTGTIEAHRRGDSWEVALSCTVRDDDLDDLIARVWQRGGGL